MIDAAALERLGELYDKTQTGVPCTYGFRIDPSADEAFDNALRPLVGDLLRLARLGLRVEGAPLGYVVRSDFSWDKWWAVEPSKGTPAPKGDRCRIVEEPT